MLAVDDIQRITRNQYEYKQGGTWTGSPHGVFLYEYMIREPWTFHVQPPPSRLFNGRTFCLLQDLHYWPAGHNVPATAHAGMFSDGGTIRTVMGWASLSTPFRDYLPPFLIHDALCSQARTLMIEEMHEQAVQLRLHADRLFRVMILDVAAARGHSGRWDAWIGYRAVRVGAWYAGLT